MRFIFPILALASLFMATACNPIGCAVEQKVVDGVSGFVVSSLQCANADVVKTDLTKLVQAVAPNLCSSAVQGPIANTVCPALANSIVDFAAVNGIPGAWGCSAQNASALVKDKLISLCEQIPL